MISLKDYKLVNTINWKLIELFMINSTVTWDAQSVTELRHLKMSYTVKIQGIFYKPVRILTHWISLQ